MSRIDFLSKINWPQVVAESVLIVFSILLALVVNEMRTSSRLDKQKDQLLVNIAVELEQNLNSVKKVLPYHRQSLEELDSIIQNIAEHKEHQAFSVIFKVLDKGLQEPRIQNTAWETAKLTTAFNQFPHDTMYELANLYKMQNDGVESTWRGIVVAIFDRNNFNPELTEVNLQILQRYLQELASQEEFLIFKLEETLQYLDSITS